MNLSDLVDILQLKNRDLPPAIVKAAVRRVFREITETLSRGGRVELRGFGAFSVRERESWSGRNPRPAEPVEVPDKRSVRFRAGKALSDRLQDKTGG